MEELIRKIIDDKANEEIDEVKVDLERVINIRTYNINNTINIDSVDYGYITYLYRYYDDEIKWINANSILIPIYQVNIEFSAKDDMINYLVKIALLRICKKKGIQIMMDRINKNDINYCKGILD